MQYIADFHIHSKYSRATSQKMDLEYLDQWAKIKGIDVLGTGDFTHPKWFKELKEKLEPLGNGLYKLQNRAMEKARLETANNFFKEKSQKTNFILSTEISCIYSKNDKVRRIHIMIFVPSLEVAEKINIQFSWIGNLKADGRPILGLDAKELAKIALEISEECLIVPAHIWTPWFSLFGSQGGFDSIEECFEELTPQIYALETGLSSDPAMNWRLSALDNYTLISNSDAHSLANLGREANVFEGNDLSYSSIIKALKRGKANDLTEDLKLIYTIEFFPEEGKYHYDGHRSCKIRFSPEETKRAQGICPKCKKLLTVGVMNRVVSLADRDKGIKPEGAANYKNLVPLQEIIAEALDKAKGTKAVDEEYQNLVKKGKNEFNILLNLSYQELKKITLSKIIEGIKRVREGKIEVLPGYDGVYGTVKAFPEGIKEVKQTSLF